MYSGASFGHSRHGWRLFLGKVLRTALVAAAAMAAGCTPIVVKNPEGLNASLPYFVRPVQSGECGKDLRCDDASALQALNHVDGRPVGRFAPPSCSMVDGQKEPVCATSRALRLQYPMRLRVTTLRARPSGAADELPLVPGVLEWAIPRGVWPAAKTEADVPLTRRDLLTLRYLHRVATPDLAICDTSAPRTCEAWALRLASMNLAALVPSRDNQTTCADDGSHCAHSIRDAFERPLLEWHGRELPEATVARSHGGNASSLCWGMDAYHSGVPNSISAGNAQQGPRLGNPAVDDAVTLTYAAGAMKSSSEVGARQARLVAFGGSDWQFAGRAVEVPGVAARANASLAPRVKDDQRTGLYYPQAHVEALVPIFIGTNPQPSYVSPCTRLGDLSDVLTLGTRRPVEVERRCAYVDRNMLHLEEPGADGGSSDKRVERARERLCPVDAQILRLVVAAKQGEGDAVQIAAGRLDLAAGTLSQLLVAPFDHVVFDMN